MCSSQYIIAFQVSSSCKGCLKIRYIDTIGNPGYGNKWLPMATPNFFKNLQIYRVPTHYLRSISCSAFGKMYSTRLIHKWEKFEKTNDLTKRLEVTNLNDKIRQTGHESINDSVWSIHVRKPMWMCTQLIILIISSLQSFLDNILIYLYQLHYERIYLHSTRSYAHARQSMHTSTFILRQFRYIITHDS